MDNELENLRLLKVKWLSCVADTRDMSHQCLALVKAEVATHLMRYLLLRALCVKKGHQDMLPSFSISVNK